MIRMLVIGGFLFASLTSTAQSVSELVADEVCRCLEEMPEIVYPRLQARQCLERTAERYAELIRNDLGLRVNSSTELDRLADTLATRLSEDCSILREMTGDEAEPQLRYSDIPLARISQQITAPKFPDSDPSELTSWEVTEERLFTGRVISAGPGGLVVEDDAARSVHFTVSSRQLRQLTLEIGEAITVIYRLDWQQDPTRILPVLINVK